MAKTNMTGGRKPSSGTKSIYENSAQVISAMLKKLASSALTKKDAATLKFVPCTATEAPKELPAAKSGFLIPYFNASGKPTKFWRYRYLEPTKKGFKALTKAKDLRYAQPADTINELYLPPFVDWAAAQENTEQSLIITEGELKAACATKHGFPTIGLGGVWSFKSKQHNLPLLPQFEEFQWGGRVVYIIYDSDAASNWKVAQAENALARELTKLGALVRIGRIEAAPGTKYGIDDLIAEKGVEAFEEVLAAASPYEECWALFEMNEEVVYVEDPGVILRVDTLQRMTPSAFCEHAYSTRTFTRVEATEKGNKQLTLSTPREWLKWPKRSAVARTTFAPGEGRVTADNELNMWKGWGCQPKEGDVTPWTQLLDHLFGDNREERDWFEKWLAYPLQHPGAKLYTSVLLWGRKTGTGKSLIGYSMFRIYGCNATEIGERDLHSVHNEWAENKQFVMGEEISGGDKRAQSDRMKAMVTQKLLRLNPKYVPAYTVIDCINYYFTSNHGDSFFLEDEDRRAFIHEVVAGRLPREFYVKYVDWMLRSEEGPAALFYHLLNLDLSGFDPHAEAPMTNAKQAMIELGRSDLGQWVATLRDSPDTVLRLNDQVLPFKLWTAQDLLALYDPDTRRVTSNGMARELTRAGFRRAREGEPIKTSEGQKKLWLIRDSEELSKIGWKELGQLYDKERGLSSKDDAPKPTKKAKF